METEKVATKKTKKSFSNTFFDPQLKIRALCSKNELYDFLDFFESKSPKVDIFLDILKCPFFTFPTDSWRKFSIFFGGIFPKFSPLVKKKNQGNKRIL